MKQYIMHVLGSVSQELYFPDAHLTDIIEILILTYLIYHIAMWLINTKAWMLMRGIVVLGIFVLLAAVFKMHTILFLARNSVTVLATAAVVVFQPELRRALEKLGEKQFLSSIVPFETNKESSRFSEDTMDSIIDAAYNMGRVKTGALIVVEQAIHHFTMGLSLSVVTESYLQHVICHCLITWGLARSLEQGTEQR